MRSLKCLFLSALACTGAHATDLPQQVLAFAGRPPIIDPRLHIPDCSYQLAWHDARQRAILAQCPENGWRMLVPLAAERAEAPAAAVPTIRRGDPVQVEAAGAGYRLLVDGVADGPARAGGRVIVRNLQSGRRMVAEMGEDGVLRLAGKNPAAGY